MLNFTRKSTQCMKKIINLQDEFEMNENDQDNNFRIRSFSKEQQQYQKPSQRMHKLNDSSKTGLCNTQTHSSLTFIPTTMSTQHDIIQNQKFNSSNTINSKDKYREDILNTSTSSISNDKINLNDQENHILQPIYHHENLIKKPPVKPKPYNQLKTSINNSILHQADKQQHQQQQQHMNKPNKLYPRIFNSIKSTENDRPLSPFEGRGGGGGNGSGGNRSSGGINSLHTSLSKENLRGGGGVSGTSKNNGNKNVLQQIGDSIMPNHITNKALISKFLMKNEVTGLTNTKSLDKIDESSSSASIIKDKKKSIPNQVGTSISYRESMPDYYNPFSKISTRYSHPIKENNSRKKLECISMEDSILDSGRLSKQNLFDPDKKMNSQMLSLSQNLLEKSCENLSKLLMRGPNDQKIELDKHLSSQNSVLSMNGQVIEKSNTKVNNGKLNKSLENDLDPLKISKSEGILSKSIAPSNCLPVIINSRNDTPNSLCSLLTESKSKVNSGACIDKNQWMNTIIDLKNKIHEKELEILELKNDKVKNDKDNQELLIQVKDLINENKRLEESIEKLNQINSSNEKEIDFLKNLKNKLEANVNDNLENNQQSWKIKFYESKIEEKHKEIKELHDKIFRLSSEHKILIEAEKTKFKGEIGKFEGILKEKEMHIKKLEEELMNNNSLKKEYASIEKKILELEEMQNILINENGNLKLKNGEQTKIIKQKENEMLEAKEVFLQLFTTRKKLKELDEVSKRLIEVLETAIKGEEPSMDLILKHHKSLKDKKKTQNNKESTKDLLNQQGLSLKQLAQQNHTLVNLMYQCHSDCLDSVYDQYVQRYGNECNLQ